jgi:hypothetical protein
MFDSQFLQRLIFNKYEFKLLNAFQSLFTQFFTISLYRT